ncbi:hypothetical protein KC19_2G232300 [Ceratodon purpureus]|uniref:Transmembrane protein n=1 Tax=Ceratodon purpureus TaxID=3225 RepID=A0A8T0J081_CERPU|nr:hypothetical protein KC19_2G232300 [Ceratodon purpureus]
MARTSLRLEFERAAHFDICSSLWIVGLLECFVLDLCAGIWSLLASLFCRCSSLFYIFSPLPIFCCFHFLSSSSLSSSHYLIPSLHSLTSAFSLLLSPSFISALLLPLFFCGLTPFTNGGS